MFGLVKRCIYFHRNPEYFYADEDLLPDSRSCYVPDSVRSSRQSTVRFHPYSLMVYSHFQNMQGHGCNHLGIKLKFIRPSFAARHID
ncbi:hypothetical protein AFLA_005566 [Aspergillus flavus NRRL3357]|nr:hypothetical protein AFLA_005566 [Aspergillus flavus NRRL3357]